MAVIFALTAVYPSSAQTLVSMPPPGSLVPLSQAFNPPSLKGIKVYPDNPFRFDFILDPGEERLDADALKEESGRLIRYFLTSLTMPEKDLWVNLSPYEQERIITNEFGQTEMGRDLLEQDYLLKQITASVMYPEGEVGKKFWSKVYQAAFEMFGTTDIPMDTFNKVWITPDKAEVFENEGQSLVIESHLKVLLESDYLAQERILDSREANTDEKRSASVSNGDSDAVSATRDLSKQILREIILPELEKEVNEGRNFAPVRQVYRSLILAAWFKKKVKESLLSKVYVDRKKVTGVNIDDPEMSRRIWQQYVEAFKKGAYNYIKEEQDPYSQEILPRKYFSGGFDYSMLSDISLNITHDRAQLSRVIAGGLIILAVGLSSGNSPVSAQDLIPKTPVTTEQQQEWQGITPDLLYRNATVMGRISENQLKESIEFSDSKRPLVNDVRSFLMEKGILNKDSPPIRILFLKGLSRPGSLGPHHASFALAISERGNELIVVSADAFEGLGERDAFPLLAIKYAHEGTHTDDFRANLNPTPSEKMASEARAYQNTVTVMEKLSQEGRASYSRDQLDAQRAVAKAFFLWMTGKNKIKDFQNYYYTNVSIVSLRAPSVILIDLVNEENGGLAQVKINTDKGTVQFQPFVFLRERVQTGRDTDRAQSAFPDLSRKWPSIPENEPVGLVQVPGRTATLKDFNRTVDRNGRSFIFVYRGLKNVSPDAIKGAAHQSLAAANNIPKEEAYKRYGASVEEAVLRNIAQRGAENDATLHTTLNPEMARRAATIGNGTVVTYRIPVDWLTDNRPVVAQKGDVEEEVAFYYDLPAEFVHHVDPLDAFTARKIFPAREDSLSREQVLDRAQRSLFRALSGILLVASLTFGVGCEPINTQQEPPGTTINLPAGWDDLTPELIYSHGSRMGEITPEQLKRSIEISVAKQAWAGEVESFLKDNGLLPSDTPPLRVLFLTGLSRESSLGTAHRSYAMTIVTSKLVVVSADAFEGLSDKEAFALLAIKIAHEGRHVRDYYMAPGIGALEDEALAFQATYDAMAFLQREGLATYSAEALNAQRNVAEAFRLLLANRSGLPNFKNYYYDNIELALPDIVRIYLFNMNNTNDQLRAEINVTKGTVEFQRKLVTPGKGTASEGQQGTDDADPAQGSIEGVVVGESVTAENLEAVVDGIARVDRQARFQNNPDFGRNHRLERGTIEAYLKDPDVKVYWAQKDGQIIGFSICSRINSAEPYLSRVASLPDAPSGLGSLLLDRLIGELRAAGKMSLAFIPFSRTRSLEFFKKYASRQKGEIKLKSTSSVAWQFDFAMKEAVYGGIDFNTDRLDLQVQNSGGGVKFNVDPIMVRRFDAMPGFSPVLIDMRPLSSIQSFLGIPNN